jgi:hypothetical protein
MRGSDYSALAGDPRTDLVDRQGQFDCLGKLSRISHKVSRYSAVVKGINYEIP